MEFDTNLQSRINREHQAHTTNDMLKKSHEIKNLFHHIWNYPSRKRMSAQIEKYLFKKIERKRVLDYGCGRGEGSLKYLKNGAFVYGIDISPKYINHANMVARAKGYPESKYSFNVMDAHRLEFEDHIFDIIIGEGILHHLDTTIALKEVSRVLKPGGRVLMLEPLADNPLLKLYRAMTPHWRTKDERPFSKEQLKLFSNNRQWHVEMIYCGILEAPMAVLTSIIIHNDPDNILIRITDKLENWTHKHRLLLSWNQYVLFNMVKL